MEQEQVNQDTPISDSTELEKSQLEIENLNRQNQKLILEIEELRDKNRWEKRLRLFSVITPLLAIGGFLFGFYSLGVQQQQNLKQYTLQLQKNNEERQQAFKQPFWNKQLESYFATSEATSTIATAKDKATRDQAEKRFNQLFWGPLVIVADVGEENPDNRKLEKSMFEFKECLDNKGACDQKELERRSVKIANDIRESIGKTWEIPLSRVRSR